MKSILFIIAVLATISLRAQKATGNLYKDMETFYTKTRPAAPVPADIISILSFYANRALTEQEAKDILDSTKLLATYSHLIIPPAPAAATKTHGGTPHAGGALTTSLTSTNLADGIAKFLIDRGKQEISIAFFERLRNEFNRYAELKYLLPTAYAIVKDIESHNILNLLQELREAFIKDLNTMPSNILSIRALTPDEINDACNGANGNDCVKRITDIQNQLNLATSPDIDATIKVITLVIMQSLIDGDDIITVFDNISTDDGICADKSDFINYVKISTILLNCIRTSTESDGIFIPKDKLMAVMQDAEKINILLGLASVKYVHDKCFRKVEINSVKLDNILTNIATSRKKITDLAAMVDKVNRAFNAAKDPTLVVPFLSGQPPKVIYRELLTNSVNIAAEAVQLVANIAPSANIPDPKTPAVAKIVQIKAVPHYKRLIENIKIGADFYTDARDQNYAAIFVDLTRIITNNNILGTKDNVRDVVLKYLAFGANLASATTSDEVKDAIDAIALPVGSYSVKRNSAFNIALNGYIGYAWDRTSKGKYAQGIYAPVGVSFSKGLPLGKGWSSSITIFAGLIDVGAIASYRLINSNTDDLKQDVRLESIVSPSAQLVLGVPKTPLTIAAGWRRTPRLFYDNTQTQTIDVKQPKDVFNLSILIDIPIVNFMNLPPRH